MEKKADYTAPISQLTRYRTFEDLKAAPISFPSTKALAERQAEWKEAFVILRASYTEGGRSATKRKKKY